MDEVGHYGVWLSVTENNQLEEKLCDVSMLNTFVADTALSWTTGYSRAAYNIDIS